MKIGIIGCTGRMGRELCQAVHNNNTTELSGGFVRSTNKNLNKDLGLILGVGEIGINCTDDLEALCKESDAIIDFSTPTLTKAVAKACQNHNTILICGTTGISEKDFDEFKSQAPIVWSPNMSIGINLLCKLAAEAAKKLDEDYDIEILEMHHKHKKDAPSGTALRLGEVVAESRNKSKEEFVLDRQTSQGLRKRGDIGFATLRGGGVIGDHSVIFAGDGERIELTHKANNRSIYADGSIKAVLWCRDKAPGLYSMVDVIS